MSWIHEKLIFFNKFFEKKIIFLSIFTSLTHSDVCWPILTNSGRSLPILTVIGQVLIDPDGKSIKIVRINHDRQDLLKSLFRTSLVAVYIYNIVNLYKWGFMSRVELRARRKNLYKYIYGYYLLLIQKNFHKNWFVVNFSCFY